MWGRVKRQPSAGEGNKRREKPRLKACWQVMFDNPRGLCLNNEVRAMALMRGGTVLPGALSQRNTTISTDNKDLVWVELDMSSLPQEVRKHAEAGFHHRKLAKEEFEKTRKALEKRWTDANRISAAEEVLVAPDRFGKEQLRVARKPRAASKASNKPVVAW